ncbi:MAG: MFS transporter [Cytophagales bacterium]
MTETIQFSSYQKKVIVMLALLQFTVVLDFMILNPLGDILIKSMSMSTKQFGLIVSAYAFSAGLSGILAAGYADKYDRKNMLLFFYVGFVVGTLLCGMANSFVTLMLARIVTGLFGGVIASIGMAIITDLFEAKQRGKVMGFVQMSFAVSQVLGIPLGIYIANLFGWKFAFFGIVIFSIPLGLYVYKNLNPISEHLKLQNTKNAFAHLIQTLTNGNYQKGFWATALLSIGGFMLMPFGSAFLVNNIHISQQMLPVIFLVTGLFSMVMMPIVGKMSDTYDRFKIFAIGSIWGAVMVVLYTHLPVVPLWIVLVVNVGLFVGIMSRMVPSGSLNSMVPLPQDRGAYMSITSSLQQIAGGVGAMIAGFIVVQKTKTSPIENYGILGFVCAALILICIYFTWRVSKLVVKK